MNRQSTVSHESRAWVEVDLGAVVRNARTLGAHARVPLIPMVKADAYGLGAVAVAKALEAIDPFAFGVSSIDEGIELRDAGVRRPIIIFTPALPGGTAGWRTDDLDRMARHGITPTLADPDQIRAWRAGGESRAYHLAIDTGMHRAGVNFDRVASLHDVLLEHPPAGVFTHFHSAELDDGSMEQQEMRFREALALLPRRPALVHAENSAGIVRRGPSAWDLVRPGVFLYGVGGRRTGDGGAVGPQPEAVASLRARLLEIRDVAAGEGVSYDATWRAERPTRVATVACGYADGLRRHLGNRAHALVRGRRAPIRGVVTMDMAMIDLTGIPEAEVGDVATFLGRDGSELLTAEAVASAGALSPYELLVGLKLRLPRFHVGS